jgi:hypothetical protein
VHASSHNVYAAVVDTRLICSGKDTDVGPIMRSNHCGVPVGLAGVDSVWCRWFQ